MLAYTIRGNGKWKELDIGYVFGNGLHMNHPVFGAWKRS